MNELRTYCGLFCLVYYFANWISFNRNIFVYATQFLSGLFFFFVFHAFSLRYYIFLLQPNTSVWMNVHIIIHCILNTACKYVKYIKACYSMCYNRAKYEINRKWIEKKFCFSLNWIKITSHAKLLTSFMSSLIMLIRKLYPPLPKLTNLFFWPLRKYARRKIVKDNK